MRSCIYGFMRSCIYGFTRSCIYVLLVYCDDFHYIVHRGLLVRSLLQAQSASPTFTHVYAALVAVLNTKVRELDVSVVVV